MIFLLGQELHRGLGDYLLFAPRYSPISANKEGIISESLPGKNRKCQYSNLNSQIFFLGYLVIRLLELSLGTIILPPFPSFFRHQQKMLISKRRNSDPVVAGNSVDLKITAPRQTEKTATELCSFAIIWWSFWNFLVYSRLMEYKDLRAEFRGKG